jgi:hypothetical protein
MEALQSQQVRFQVIGMSAAILQGVPGSTQDIDLWLDLPPRRYMRAINIALTTGARMIRNTVVELSDGTLVNFVYQVTGLRKFATEYRAAKLLAFHGRRVPVMPLESICRSKDAIRRPKDLVHLDQISRLLRLKRSKWRRK